MTTNRSDRLSVGIAGLDEILLGGLFSGRSYLVRGGPGTGKTTVGLHFLASGAARGEKGKFITLEEPEPRIRSEAEARGFDLSEVAFLDLSPSSDLFATTQSYDVFSATEAEHEPVAGRIIEGVKAVKPQRVFLDPITLFRYLCLDLYQFRRQVVSFLRFLKDEGVTVLLASEATEEAPDNDLQAMTDGVIDLHTSRQGPAVSVQKVRGCDFRSGEHAMRLGATGIEVYPRLLPETHGEGFAAEVIPTGVPELDRLLNGGLERGSVTLISGPSGVGKTTLGLQFMKESAARGERSVVYLFEEEVKSLLTRAESVNIPAPGMIERGTLSVRKIEPLYWSPDEFAQFVRREVEEEKTRVVMIDGVAGYRLALRGEDIIRHLHALCKYLQNRGAACLLLVDTSKVIGDFQVAETGISYLADNIVFLCYLEMNGELRKAIGVLKKRASDFEKTVREFKITADGIKVGKPLTGLRGILTGTPEWAEGRKPNGM